MRVTLQWTGDVPTENGTTFAISIDLGDRSVSLNAQKAPDVVDVEPKYVDPFHLTSE